MKKIYPILVVLLASCSTASRNNERPIEWIGEWKAEWHTPPESPSYQGIVDMEFYMDGAFIFTEDSLTVQNNGYPGCIFAIDTLVHTQLWSISSDTLLTYNDSNNTGMTYQIKSVDKDQIQLQLMDDIFVKLSR